MSLKVDIRKKLDGFLLETAFEVENGVTGLLGASGCGKSITLRCIAGIMKPDAGRIVLDGVTLFDSEKHIHLPPQLRQVGLLFQNYALFPNMNVEQNLMAGIHKEKDKRAKKKAVYEMMEKFHLTELAYHMPAQLSGGQQQRTALARILLSEPRILMLDEPFSALDSYLRWEMEMELSDHLKEFCGTTLFVSHSRDEIYRLCERVCVISEGKSQPVVSIEELFSAPATQAAALLSGCKNYSLAKKAGSHQAEAVEWGKTFLCGREVPAEIEKIGVRSHYLYPASEKETNALECIVTRVVDDVFSTIVMLHPCHALSQKAELRMELEKEKSREIQVGNRMFVAVKPENILLLKE